MLTRVTTAALTGALVALGLSGCAFITPQQTQVSYQPSDGVQGSVGTVDIRNTMLISTDGTAASLVANLINTGTAAQTVQVQYDSSGSTAEQSVVVPANTSVAVRPGTDAVVTLAPITAPLGSLFSVAFLVGSDSTTLSVPVLNTSLPGYASLAPSPTPTATSGSSPDSTQSPSPSDSATPDTTSPAPSPSATP